MLDQTTFCGFQSLRPNVKNLTTELIFKQTSDLYNKFQLVFYKVISRNNS